MKAITAFVFLAHSLAEIDCGNKQDRFNVVMCESHMCTDCSLAWCTEACQKISGLSRLPLRQLARVSEVFQ